MRPKKAQQLNYCHKALTWKKNTKDTCISVHVQYLNMYAIITTNERYKQYTASSITMTP